MNGGPFPPDRRRAARRAGLIEAAGPAFEAALANRRSEGGADPRHPRAVIPARLVADLVRALRLRDVEEVMLVAIETARALARPPVSGYRVGAVGLAEPSGDLVLGGNLELSGASAWHTVHAEGFVTLLARARGERLRTLAISQARPCAHCRQVLAEIEGAGESGGTGQSGGAGGAGSLVIIDPAGRRLRLADVYPWPFLPEDLGIRGCVPGTVAWPDLALADAALPDDVATALVHAVGRAHAPYTGAPAAVALRLRDGWLATGSLLESVAFNPTIGPLQDALVDLVAAGREPGDVEAAWLAVPREPATGHEAMARDALAALAPGAPLHVTYWS